MEYTPEKNEDAFLDDLISSALQDLEVLEQAGHFNGTSNEPIPKTTTTANSEANKISEDDLIERMLKEFDSNSGYQGLVQGMMKQLLSKEVLYEPMKEMRDKYPQWLKDNKEKLTREE